MFWRNLNVCCLLLLLLVASPSQAATSIGASASDDGCGRIAVNGTITLDNCCWSVSSTDATVSVFQNGCVVTTFTVPIAGTTFSGASTDTFAAGNYVVVVQIGIADPCSNVATYTFNTSVTVK